MYIDTVPLLVSDWETLLNVDLKKNLNLEMCLTIDFFNMDYAL